MPLNTNTCFKSGGSTGRGRFHIAKSWVHSNMQARNNQHIQAYYDASNNILFVSDSTFAKSKSATIMANGDTNTNHYSFDPTALTNMKNQKGFAVNLKLV